MLSITVNLLANCAHISGKSFAELELRAIWGVFHAV